ncbi:unnamed protein product [Lasius platythorax]|uniref:Endonuclease/exonuclease/phosphatase domain-containing protein n=1 Tax=Lasius platythorax TaxID=488582 RepID=A0AAV2NTR9_9HYME
MSRWLALYGGTSPWNLVMDIKVLQANVNRSKRSLDLLIHQASERNAGIVLISEANGIPASNGWFVSGDGKAAIFCDPNQIKLRCRLAKQGRKYVAVFCGPYLLISVYISPTLDLNEFDKTLGEISEAINCANRLIVGGDFNAKSVLWGSRYTDGRGRLLARWAAERDLCVANVGDKPTCVRPQGTSVVDITWVSPDLFPFIGDWRVEEGVESLSDHLYISFSLGTTRTCPSARRLPDRRWNRKKFDSDFFRAVLIWKGQEPDVEDRMDVEQMASWLDRIMVEACDAAAPRIGPKKPRRRAYWWQDSVALIRRECIRARRLWQREKGKNRP